MDLKYHLHPLVSDLSPRPREQLESCHTSPRTRLVSHFAIESYICNTYRFLHKFIEHFISLSFVLDYLLAGLIQSFN
jgi:hypothetical protein